MGLNLEQKQAVVSEIAAQLGKAQAVIVAEYRGLDVGSVTELRAKARKSGLYLRVLKNTLARRAVKGTPFEKLSEQMSGPLMYGIAQDPVAGAKVLAAFAKDNEKFVIKGGVMANALMSVKDVKTLATMPSREELLAKLAGTLQAPIAKLARTLSHYGKRVAILTRGYGNDEVQELRKRLPLAWQAWTALLLVPPLLVLFLAQDLREEQH